jgi:hypothetical protein
MEEVQKRGSLTTAEACFKVVFLPNKLPENYPIMQKHLKIKMDTDGRKIELLSSENEEKPNNDGHL